MKKIIFLLFLKIIALNCISQVEYLNNTSTWKEVKQYNDFINWHYEKYYHKFINDTVINNNLYYKVYKIGIDSIVPPSGSSYINQIYQYIGAIREDSSKFFFVNNSFNTEATLYDFNFSVGDTIPIEFYNGYSCYPSVISTIDTVFFGSTPRKRFFLANDGNYFYFIEGIGTKGGLFGKLCITYETASNLVCYGQDYSQIQISTSIDCDIVNGLASYSKENLTDLIIVPNPNNGEFTINVNNSKNTAVAIYNSMGIKLKTEHLKSNSSELKIMGLTAGVYFVVLESEGKRIGGKKVIVN